MPTGPAGWEAAVFPDASFHDDNSRSITPLMYACGWPVPRQQFRETFTPAEPPSLGFFEAPVKPMNRNTKTNLVMDWQANSKLRPTNAKVLNISQFTKRQSHLSGYLGFKRVLHFLLWCDGKGLLYVSLIPHLANNSSTAMDSVAPLVQLYNRDYQLHNKRTNFAGQEKI